MNITVAQQQPRVLPLAALAGAAGPILFVVLVIIGGLLYDGYSHIDQAISELGGAGAPYPLLQKFNFVMMGASALALAWALARRFGSPALGFLLLGVFGVSAGILQAVFPCDLGCRGATTVGLLHNVFGVAGFVAAIASMFLLARRWQNAPGWQEHARLSRLCGLVAIGGLLGFIVVAALKLGVVPGLLQRVFVSALLFWIVATALRLQREFR